MGGCCDGADRVSAREFPRGKRMLPHARGARTQLQLWPGAAACATSATSKSFHGRALHDSLLCVARLPGVQRHNGSAIQLLAGRSTCPSAPDSPAQCAAHVLLSSAWRHSVSLASS
eukprot:scaffold3844_cov234-Prasinococcus_capsulatus_cf.AAC.3